MAIHWERLAGDTSAFAIRIAFMDDPDEGQGASTDASLSWGAFQIWVNGWNLCAHLEEDERVESAHWYLLPLLEWFVDQWNPLLHLEGAAAYLSSIAPESSRIAELKRAIPGLRMPQQDDSRVMWLAGLGVDEASIRQGWNRFKRQIAAFSEEERNVLLATSGDSPLLTEGSCHAALMFGTMAPTVQEQDVMVLAGSLLRLTSPDGDCEALARRCRAEPMGNSSNPPWQQGYALAEELHDDLDDCMDGEPVDVEAILDRLGVDVTEASLSDASIRGVAIAGPHHRSGILWNRNNHFNADVRGLRFTLAHELCHLLFDRNAGQRLAVASGPWAPPSLEKRANAFAAMLLMPTETIHALAADMDEPMATAQDVSRVAERLQTGFSATLWHLQNLGFVDDISMQRIEAEQQWL